MKKATRTWLFYFLAAKNQLLILLPSAFCATAVTEAELFCLVAVLVSVLISPPAFATSLAKSTVDGLRLAAACCCAWTAVAALLEEMVLVVMVNTPLKKRIR